MLSALHPFMPNASAPSLLPHKCPLRTEILNTRQADHGKEKEDGGEEPEFQVIDGKEREGIVEWVRRHKSAFRIAIAHVVQVHVQVQRVGLWREGETRMSSRRAGRVTVGPCLPATPVPTPASVRGAKKVTMKAAPVKWPLV